MTSALLCLAVPAAQAHDRWRGDVESGADDDEIYTFALVHYLAAGVVVRF